MEPATGTSRKAKPTRRLKLSWRYWKTPVLFGVGLCALQILVGSGADRIVGAIRLGVRYGDAAYAAMT